MLGSFLGTGFPGASRLRRVGRLVRLGAETLVRTVVHKVRRLLAPPGRREKLDDDHRQQTMGHVVDTVGEMKGLAMKVGQQASYMLSPVTPDPVAEQLARLQQDAPPMDSSAAGRVVERALGRPASVVFAEWNPIPIAAASIGQVHRAVTHDGEVVAVKVQYPGAEDALRADIDNVGVLGKITVRRSQGPEPKPPREASDGGERQTVATPGVDPLSMDALLEQFKARLIQETDYVREAANQELIGSAFRDDPLIHVPRVYRHLSTRTVLTTELANGARFSELLAWDQDQRDLAGQTLFRFHHEALFRVGHHNADPHPGNYIFGGDGRVTFLDFGALWDVAPEFLEGAPRLLEVLEAAEVETSDTPADPAEFAKISRQGGTSTPSPMASLGWFYDQLVVAGRRPLPQPLESLLATMSGGRTFKFATAADEAFVGEMARHIGQSANALLGVQAVLATLGARCDWAAIGRKVLAASGS